MITIALTYRNRELRILKKCLDSLKNQNNNNFKVVLVDYGSLKVYTEPLNQLVKAYDFLSFISCETQGQLWCKSRAINIALKKCDTPYFFVGDIDMLFHPDFVNHLQELKDGDTVTYFQVGFLSEKESLANKEFEDYNINFRSNAEATGMTLYSTDVLKAVNGYDEFYHGWGSEDTDVHCRLMNAGYTVNFFAEKILMLHQWHKKAYRELNYLTPFHSGLEQINLAYLEFTKKLKKIKANSNFSWGTYNTSGYKALEKVAVVYQITNKKSEVKGFVNNILLSEREKVIKVEISEHEAYRSLKQTIKKLLGKKTIAFLEMEAVNNMLLETIISNLRTNPYSFSFSVKNKHISLTIKL